MILWKDLLKELFLPCLVFSQLNDNQISLSIFVSRLKPDHFDPVRLLFLQQKPLIEMSFFLRQIVPYKISDKLAEGFFLNRTSIWVTINRKRFGSKWSGSVGWRLRGAETILTKFGGGEMSLFLGKFQQDCMQNTKIACLASFK